jgi:antitoxin PrlF
MTRATPVEEDDPVLGKFLEFLERDIAAHPEHVRAVGTELAARIRALVRDAPVDLEAPLPADDK